MIHDPRKDVIDKIKKCLALGDSERNPNANEAETALRMAKKLMDEYNISMADVAFTEANFGSIREEALRARAGIPRWETSLAWVCDNLFGTKHFLKTLWEEKKFDRGGYSDRAERTSVVFYGYDHDIALSIEVYKLLKLEILGLARTYEIKEQAANPGWTPGQVRTKRFAYCEGIVWSLVKRSKDASTEMSQANAAKVRDLVVRKDVEIDAWAKRIHPDLHPARRRGSSMHDDATFEGTKDGAKVSLNFKNTVRSKASTEALPWKGGGS